MDARLLVFPLAMLALLGFVCASPPPPTQVPVLDYDCFVTELLASCGFSNCHGAADRPMRLFSPAGNRLRPNLPTTELTEEEHLANYHRVRGYAAPTSAELPDLLRKPLQTEAGGSGHDGEDAFGRNVYASKEDPRWQLVSSWVSGDVGPCAREEPPDGGTPEDGGVTPTCTPGTYSYQANIAPIVNPQRCSDSSCHTPQNVSTGDAGCFLPDSCQTVLAGGCGSRRSVLPCDVQHSKLYLYTGVPPYKAHQGKLSSAHRQSISDWIDAGAPCD
jgi:hypothetical protein